MRLLIAFLSMLLLNTAFADEPPLPTKLSTEDTLRLDNAQTHIREILLIAQQKAGPYGETIQTICKTYKIDPCKDLEQVVDMKTGTIKRAPPPAKQPAPTPPQQQVPPTPTPPKLPVRPAPTK